MPYSVDSPLTMWQSATNNEAHRAFPQAHTPRAGFHNINHGWNQNPSIPVPKEYTPGCAIPSFFGVQPNQPIGVPERPTLNLNAEDVKPNLQDLHLLRKSFQEFKACRDIFDSLIEGMARRLKSRSDSIENTVFAKVIALREGFESAMKSCETLCQSCEGFIQTFATKLIEVSARGGGEILPDKSLQEKCDEFLAASLMVEDYVQVMLVKLDEVITSINNAKDTSKRQKLWDWFVESFSALQGRINVSHAVVTPVGIIVGTSVTSEAYSLAMTIPKMRDARAGIENILDLLSRVIRHAAKQVESHLISVRAYQKILQSSLGVGERFSGRMNDREARRAGAQWKEALEKVRFVDKQDFPWEARMHGHRFGA